MATDRVEYSLEYLPFGFLDTSDIKGIKNEHINRSPSSFWGSVVDENSDQIKTEIQNKLVSQKYPDPVIFKNDGMKSFNEIEDKDLDRLCIYIWSTEKWGQSHAAPLDCKFHICCGIPTEEGSATSVLNIASDSAETLDISANDDFSTTVFPRLVTAIMKSIDKSAGKGGTPRE